MGFCLAGCLGGGGAKTLPPPASAGAGAAAPAKLAEPEARRQLRESLDALFGDPRFSNAWWGARVERMNGEVLYDLNGARNFAPASNMKILTTAAAIALLGPDYTYETRLEAIGEITQDGRLEGDLVIVGSGDPSFGAWHPDENPDSAAILGQWADALEAAGVREITGDIIGDGRYFTEEFYSGYWELSDIPYWYAAGSSGLAIEENAFRLVFTPGENVGDTPAVEIIPPTDYMTFINEAKTAEAGGAKDMDIVERDPKSNVARIAGSLALDAGTKSERGSVWDGPRYAAYLFRETLERRGVRVAGEALNIRAMENAARIDAAPPERRRVIATWTSPPMRSLCRTVNRWSHNFFADQLLRTIGKERRGEGSFEAGEAAAKEWLASVGVPEIQALQMNDGSGLSRHNVVQPRQFCATLRAMFNDKALREPFTESLSVAGVSGWMSDRMKDTPAAGRVRAKTGYVLRVRSLSGYVLTVEDETLVFSFIANMSTAPLGEVDEAADRACILLAQYRESPAPARR